MQLKLDPVRVRQDENRDSSTLKVLLITQLLIRRHKHIELLFRFGQQLAVRQRGPADLKRRDNFIPAQVIPQRRRRPLIKENAHLPLNLGQTGFGEFENSRRLFARNTLEPL